MAGLQLKITGDKKLTTLNQEYSWTHKAKIEQDFQSNLTDEPTGRTFDLTSFTLVDFIIVNSDKVYTLTIEKASGNITIETKGTFMISPDEAVTAVTLISKTSEGQTFNLRVYEADTAGVS